MSAAVAHDMLKISRQLAASRLTAEVAAGVSETFAAVLVDRDDLLATKADLSRAEAALRSVVFRVEARVEQVEAVLRADMQTTCHELRSECRAPLADWIKGILTGTVAVAGLLFAALKLTH